MMRGIRRLVVCTAVTGLLAAGAVSASMEVAHADSVVGHCIGASDSTPTAFAVHRDGERCHADRDNGKRDRQLL